MIPVEIDYLEIKKIYNKLSTYVIETPIIKNSTFLNDFFNTKLFLKLEFLQHSGSFKARGTINNLLNLTDYEKKKGITAVSAGNHAIASAYAANIFSMKNKIFIYDTANQYRLNKAKSLNANLFLTNPQKAFKDVEKASKKEEFFFLHPFDGKFTVQGTASLGFEICQQMENIDNIIISVGGGGLIAGVGSIIHQKFPQCNIIGIEPEGAKGLSDSLKMNKPLSKVVTDSIADSLCAPLHMPYSFSICKNVINEMVTVTDQEMKKSMKFMFDHYKLALEPACVAGIAALTGPLKNKFHNQNTLVILCGSNIDMQSWLKLTGDQ